ncbi:protein SCAR3 isoform X2 [Salvia miltiorrhiza]|uniref:protein SCAR3 isoform X2 n=1 Tax=Salvia miltiorrhiza TaxID=226208 RepID=UPI0025AC54C9|nr:protein SCAR3 isoform X2 [Salvia miltiorrhiza]
MSTDWELQRCTLMRATKSLRRFSKESPSLVSSGSYASSVISLTEVFHGLNEELMETCSRSRKLMDRVLQVEAEVVPVEKAVLAQPSHLHLAYTAGVNWHVPARCQQNLFVYNDMPLFILDFYEVCRSPPQFHLLDRFDPGGPGSCLKRYSDPAIYNMTSKSSGDASTEKVAKYKKLEKTKKRRSCPMNGEVSRGASFAYLDSRMQSSSNVGRNTSFCQPTDYSALRSDLYEQSNSGKRNELCYSKDDMCSSYSMQSQEEKLRGLSAQTTGDSLNPSNAKSIGSRGNDGTIDNTNKKHIPHGVSYNFRDNGSGMPIIGNTKSKSSHEPEKPIAESSKVTSITFWSNGWEEDSSHASYLNSNAFEQKKHPNCAYQTVHGRNEDLCKGVSLMQLPSSSPPLAHMKISVQPIGGFRTSKKKLKFMEGIIDHGSIDVLPSFQLVPAVSKLNVGSDSDDDTFRVSSSPSLSDDFHSHHSESSSDQFESSILNQPFQNEKRKDTYSNEPEFATAADPPPPLPPVLWWATENSRDAMPKASNDASDLMHAASSSSQQDKPAPLNHDQDLETANEQQNKPFSSEKSDAKEEAKGGKNIDENNFLNQIRTKLMNLRPTVPSGTSTNVQVMTILEKANAIRKAVGSDDGGNCSDT